MGRASDISKRQDVNDDGNDIAAPSQRLESHNTSQLRHRRRSSTKDVSNERQMMLDQGKTFMDLENLFMALDSLEQWQKLAAEGKK